MTKSLPSKPWQCCKFI